MRGLWRRGWGSNPLPGGYPETLEFQSSALPIVPPLERHTSVCKPFQKRSCTGLPLKARNPHEAGFSEYREGIEPSTQAFQGPRSTD